MKRVFAIAFLNFFVSGALTLLIPLMLLTRGVNLADIGIILSVLPLVFLATRLLFAAVADQIGWCHIFLLINWPASLISTAIYYVAAALPTFFAGKIVEGLKESSYWAVSRTATFHLSPKRAGNEATKINAVIWLATAVGGATAGIGIAYLGFSLTIALLTVVSAAIVIPAGLLWKTNKKTTPPSTSHVLSKLNPKGKGKLFWLVSATLMFNSLSTYPLVTLLLPVFMDQQLGYSYVMIGALFMFYNIIASATAVLALKLPLNSKRAVLQAVTGLTATVLLASSGLFFPALLFALAFVRGLSIAFFEHIVVKAVRNSENVSADVGLLHVPMRFAEFFSLLLAGFAVQAIGYAPVFALTGVSFVIFSIMSYRLL